MGYCHHCHKQLPRKHRADAKYCADACRKAAARKAEKIAKANMAFKTDLTIAKHNYQAGEYSSFASSMNWMLNGIDAVFWGTPNGVLITEDSPGAATLATSVEHFHKFGRYDMRANDVPNRTLTEHTSRDPKVIEAIEAAVAENTKRACEPEELGWSFITKEAHKRQREDRGALVVKLNGLLSGPERKVWILTWADGSYGHQWPSKWSGRGGWGGWWSPAPWMW
jgi:hypothetical protein